MTDMNTPTPASGPTNDPLAASFEAMLKVDAHDAAIADLSGQVDGVKADVAEVKTRLDKIATSARPALSVDGVKGGAKDPARTAFVNGYLRTGRDTEIKSLSGATPADGGYAVPREIDAMIARLMANISPIRAIATVVQTGSAGYRKLVSTSGVASGWVAETAGRPATDTPTFAEIAPPTGELYANPAASQAMLDDAAFDVEAWLADEITREFARAEGSAFITGNGTNRPQGFLAVPTASTNDGARAFGTIQYVAAGAAGNFAAATPENRIIDLVHALKPAYRQGAAFVMNSATLARIRKFKTTDGQFLWQPGMSEGQAATLLGYPVVEAEDMPDIAADSLSIAFGNFREGYLIAERSATTILRDPFTNKPFVHFYATKRVGGQVMNSEAIKVMKFSAT